MSPVVLPESGNETKIFVLDTNVLMHDPSALFKFQEHHVYLPMTVLEELDNAKLGVSEVARNVRQTNRFIDELLTRQKDLVIDEGLQLNQYVAAEEPFKCISDPGARRQAAQIPARQQERQFDPQHHHRPQGSDPRSPDRPYLERHQPAHQGH